MPLSDLTESTQNYLKTIWNITEWSDEPASTKAIAERMGVRLSSVSDALKRLSAAGLISHTRYRSIELTEKGRRYAVAMVRRHRLIETFLVETLGYTWDQVHDEAEVLEHAVSDLLVERVDSLLGHPTRDPHGDPIPSPSGAIEQPSALTLAEHVAGGARGILTIERISDGDPTLLRLFSDYGLVPDAALQVKDVQDSELFISVEGMTVKLMLAEAEAVFVRPAVG